MAHTCVKKESLKAKATAKKTWKLAEKQQRTQQKQEQQQLQQDCSRYIGCDSSGNCISSDMWPAHGKFLVLSRVVKQMPCVGFLQPLLPAPSSAVLICRMPHEACSMQRASRKLTKHTHSLAYAFFADALLACCVCLRAIVIRCSSRSIQSTSGPQRSSF